MFWYFCAKQLQCIVNLNFGLDDLQTIQYRSLDLYVLFHICHKVNLLSLPPH